MIIDKPRINRAAECHEARVQERLATFAPLLRQLLGYDETLGTPRREGDVLTWPIVPTDTPHTSAGVRVRGGEQFAPLADVLG